MVETGELGVLEAAADIQRGKGAGGPGIETAGMGRSARAARTLASATFVTRSLDCGGGGGGCNGCRGRSLQSAGWLSFPAPRCLPRPIWRSAAAAS